jgi:hypothetical protein
VPLVTVSGGSEPKLCGFDVGDAELHDPAGTDAAADAEGDPAAFSLSVVLPDEPLHPAAITATAATANIRFAITSPTPL